MRRVIATLVLVLLPVCAPAQELEPGAYWPIPTGVNIATIIAGVNWGDVAFEPSLPVEDASAKIVTTAFAFTRSFGVAGRSANAGVVVPVVSGHLEGLYLGEHAVADRLGLGDPKIKFAMNLSGAPAMTRQQYGSYRQRLIIGVSFTVMPPLGQYDTTRIINLGTRRWSFKPEVGLSRAYGRWVVEGMAGVWFFTDNDHFLGDRTRSQAPIVATQVHVTRRFAAGMWLAADANFYTGGRTTIDGRANLDLQRNSRIGATWSKALDRHQAIRASVSQGAFTTIGANFTSFAFGYNYAWGG